MNAGMRMAIHIHSRKEHGGGKESRHERLLWNMCVCRAIVQSATCLAQPLFAAPLHMCTSARCLLQDEQQPYSCGDFPRWWRGSKQRPRSPTHSG